MKVRIAAMVMAAAAAVTLCGCTEGTNGWLEEKQPQKKISGSWGLLGGGFRIFTNDGTQIVCQSARWNPETKQIELEGLTISDKAIEMTQLSNAMMTEKFAWELASKQQIIDGILAGVEAIKPTLELAMAQNPQKSKDPGWVAQMVGVLLNDAIAKGKASAAGVIPFVPPANSGPTVVPATGGGGS